MNKVSLKMSSRLENVVFSRSVLVGFLLDLNLDVNFVNELKTVVSEGVTNAIIHGYKEDSYKEVYLEISYDDENIYLIIEDNGCGIEDIEKAKEPLYSTKQEEERAGLGFTIMEVFTDKMVITSELNKGTKLEFIKQYRGTDGLYN